MEAFDRDLASSLREQMFYQVCFSTVQDCSLEVLKKYTLIPDLRLEEISPSDDMSYDHWIGSIGIGLDGVKVYVKVHFQSRIARMLVSGSSTKLDHVIPYSVILDYMKEYLNLIMGDIKRIYRSTSETASFPKVIPSYDRGLGEQELSDINMNSWKITWNGGHVTIGSYIVSYGNVADLVIPENSNDEKSKRLEFL